MNDTTNTRASLFERIGGRDAVNTAVDKFYEKIMGDDSINHLFANTDMKRQIAKQKVFLTYAFGGAQKYSGKAMRKSHEHLELTEDHFTAVAGHLQSTLEDLDVPADLIAEVMTIVASTHDDVMNL